MPPVSPAQLFRSAVRTLVARESGVAAAEPRGVSQGVLARSAVAYQAGVPLEAFAPEVQAALEPLLPHLPRASGSQLEGNLDALVEQLGDERLLQEAIGQQALAARDLATLRLPDPFGADETQRGWGAVPVLRDNPSFRDPDYLVQVLESSGPLDPERSVAAREAFEQAVQELAPQFRLELLSETGSDAVNYALPLAVANGRARLAEKVGAEDAEALLPLPAMFDGTYGAARGILGGNGAYGNRQGAIDLSDVKIPSPTTEWFGPASRKDAARLRPLEDAALERVRELAARTRSEERPIGAIILEPIQAPYDGRLRFYRPSFLVRLRKLADELGLPLIADETLTGGGRTGKLFAFQHYRGFEPDFVIFGKAMMVNGMASWERGLERYVLPNAVVTLEGDPARLLRATQFVNSLRGGTLDNVVANGELINANSGPEVNAFGAIVTTPNAEVARELPAFDLTPEEVLEQIPRWETRLD